MFIDQTFGAAFIGLVASAMMYGVTFLQTYYYYRQYPKDTWLYKGIVAFLWFLDSLHLALCTATIYWYLVSNFGNAPNLDVGHWTMNLQTDCNGLIGLIVEVFFAYRVYKISGNTIIPAIICILACLHFSLGVYFTVAAFRLGHFSRYSSLTWVTVLGLGAATLCDIVIAVSMCYTLQRSRTGFQRTDNVISTLMMYAINTGLLTSICASASVISFAIMPTNFIWLSFFWVLGKLYVNSLLATLNSRESIREKAANGDGTFLQLSQVGVEGRSAYRYPFDGRNNKDSSPITVTVETLKESPSLYSPTSPSLYNPPYLSPNFEKKRSGSGSSTSNGNKLDFKFSESSNEV